MFPARASGGCGDEGKRKDANLLAPRRAERTSRTAVNPASSQANLLLRAPRWAGATISPCTRNRRCHIRWKMCTKTPPHMEVIALCSSALYIYLSSSGLVLFFPTSCKYLYLNQNILAKYKVIRSNSHGVIVQGKGNPKERL